MAEGAGIDPAVGLEGEIGKGLDLFGLQELPSQALEFGGCTQRVRLASADELVRIRAGDALESTCRANPERFAPDTGRLLGEVGVESRSGPGASRTLGFTHLRRR